MSDKITYTIKRQNRKTIALYIRDDQLEVRVPFHLKQAQIDEFVEKKRTWIEKTLARVKEEKQHKEEWAVRYGSLLPYRGQEYPVKGVDGPYVSFEESFCVPLALTPEQIKHGCIQIYRLLAKQVLTRKAVAFAKSMGVNPASLNINGAKTRWGSCSSKRSLNFSWRLMMADDDVIDYVVVHELAHLKEMNHSPRFWEVVGNTLPNYERCEEKLKELQERLAKQNWE
ncbi:MAG: M48 family metallopeptidase [Lachnospiraceae bacterium]|nr:M48 family metallopeptidase [Lachnospiraceae bacterium]